MTDVAAAIKSAELASVALNRAPAQIGVVTAISGFKLSCLLSNTDAYGVDRSNPTVGSLIKIPTKNSVAFGFIESLALGSGVAQVSGRGEAIANVDLLGETVSSERAGHPTFSRGISVYPVLGAPVCMATSDDIALIYAKSNAWALNIGSSRRMSHTSAASHELSRFTLPPV